MREIFPPRPEPVTEREPKAAELKREIEQSLEALELTRAEWIGNVRTLEEQIPHNDVMVDQRTYSFHVIRNAWLANLDELDTLEQEMRRNLSEVISASADV